MGIQIVTDSTCDLPTELVKKHDINVVPLYVNFGDRGYLDGIEISRQEFYLRLPHYDPPPKTATPGVDTFLDTYARLAAEGATEIISIHISEKLSATVEIARKAASRFGTIPVTVVDSRQISLGTGFVVLQAAIAAAEGQSTQEVIKTLDEFHPRVFVFAALDTLEYLRRSGRMNGMIAGIGSLLKVKPLLKMNYGEPTSEKIRTKERSIQRLIELVKDVGPLEKIALVHTNAPHAAEELWGRVKNMFPQFQNPITVNVTPVIGSHLGPNAVGFALIQALRN